MKITKDTWYKVKQLEKKCFASGQKISRSKIENEIGVSVQTARHLMFCLENQCIFQEHEKLNLTPGKTLVLSDVHIPYHDPRAIEMVLRHAEEENVNAIVILGDLIDFYKVSVFRKKPGKKDVNEELIIARAFLLDLRKRFPGAKIHYLFGNHEERIENYILSNAPELHGILENIIPEKLKLSELEIEYHDRPFKIGHLWYLHGHEKGRGGNPEYITNVIWKYVHDNFICGHFHREQSKVFSHITRKRFQGACIGWLGDPQYIEYQKIKTDIQGFAIVENDSSGYFKIYTKKIIEGRII